MEKRKLTIVPGTANPELLQLSSADLCTRLDFITGNNSLLNNKLHMFIASNNWEELVLGLGEGFNYEQVIPMLRRFGKVTVHLMSEPTQSTVEFLCKVYPEKQGALRRAFMLKKDLKEALK
jgi:hypothetical protein